MKKKIAKILILSLATTLTVSVASLGAFAENDKHEVASLSASIPSGYSIEDASVDHLAIAELESIAADLQNSGKYVEATKSTYIMFDGSPVQKVPYDGEAHGLSAGVYATIGNEKVAEANMFYVGQTADGTYYASSKAPTEAGFYYVAASYPGSDEYYPIIAYGILVIKGAEEPTEPLPTEPVEPSESESETETETGTEESSTDESESSTEESSTDESESSTEESGTDESESSSEDSSTKESESESESAESSSEDASNSSEDTENSSEDETKKDNSGASVDNNNNNSNKSNGNAESPRTGIIKSSSVYLMTSAIIVGLLSAVAFVLRKRTK